MTAEGGLHRQSGHATLFLGIERRQDKTRVARFGVFPLASLTNPVVVQRLTSAPIFLATWERIALRSDLRTHAAPVFWLSHRLSFSHAW